MANAPFPPPTPLIRRESPTLEWKSKATRSLTQSLPPPMANGTSGLVLFMTQLIEDLSNYNSDGSIMMSKTMVDLIRILV